MSWFKEKNENEELTPPFTIDRVENWFKTEEYDYEKVEDADVLRSVFNGCSVLILFNVPPFLTVQARRMEPVSTDELPQLKQWCNEWNKNSWFGTANIHTDEEDHYLTVDASQSVSAGISDEQLTQWLEIMLMCSLQCIEEYKEPHE